MAPMSDPVSRGPVIVGTSALSGHHLPYSGLGQPLSPPSTCNTSLLLASPTKSQAGISGCFWLRAAAVQKGETCPPLIWLQPQIFLQAVGPSLAEAWVCAGGSQKCLLVHRRCSLAAGQGWEPSTSSWDSHSCLLPRMGTHGCPPARCDGALLFPGETLTS